MRKLTLGALAGYVIAVVSKAGTFIFSIIDKTVWRCITSRPYNPLAKQFVKAIVYAA